MAAESTRYVKVVGLDVKDEALYRRYREGMTPILHRYGGAFGYDFVVSRVLQSETDAPRAPHECIGAWRQEVRLSRPGKGLRLGTCLV